MKKWNFFYKNEHNLSTTDKQFVTYIETHPLEFINSNINEVAQKTYISVSTISKATRKLDFASFKKLQLWVQSEINRQEPLAIKEGASSLEDIGLNIKNSYKLAIDRTLSDIDYSVFSKMKKIIKDARRIFTFGNGSSAFAAGELANSLNFLNYAATKVNTIHDMFRNVNVDQDHKVVVVIYSSTLRGQAIETMRSLLNQHHIDTILFTSNRAKQFYDNETVLLFRTLKQKKRVSALTSKIAQLLLTDIFINWFSKPINNKIYTDFSQRWR